MDEEKEFYESEKDCKNAKLRTAKRHKDGWQPVQTFEEDGKFVIVWHKDTHGKLYRFVK